MNKNIVNDLHEDIIELSNIIYTHEGVAPKRKAITLEEQKGGKI